MYFPSLVVELSQLAECVLLTQLDSISSDLALYQVERGLINKGDEVEIIGLGNSFKTTLTGIGTLIMLASHFSAFNFCSLRNVSQRARQGKGQRDCHISSHLVSFYRAKLVTIWVAFFVGSSASKSGVAK